MLPGELGRAVLCAYLLCRIADTIEDDSTLTASERAEMFDAMLAAFAGADATAAFADFTTRVSGDPAHVVLIRNAERVFALWRSLPPATAAHVERWVAEMVRGMRKVVLEHPAGIRVRTLAEYREYCYYVAGTVGYMLTDLWREHSRAIGGRAYEALVVKARAFGEALQTVNILKDVAVDAERENSIYVPDEMLRAHGSSHATILSAAHETANHAALASLVELAWSDLDDARDYLLRVPRRALAVRLFCVLPLLYAYATLRDVTRSRAMLRPGGSVKISRGEVRALLVAGILAAGSNAAIGWLVGRVRRKPFGLRTSAPAT